LRTESFGVCGQKGLQQDCHVWAGGSWKQEALCSHALGVWVSPGVWVPLGVWVWRGMVLTCQVMQLHD
jgi:hypothetical protein